MVNGQPRGWEEVRVTLPAFVSNEYLGIVSTSNYSRIASVVNGIEPPKKQFNGPKRIDPNKPLRRCQEWTAEAIEALKTSGVLET